MKVKKYITHEDFNLLLKPETYLKALPKVRVGKNRKNALRVTISQVNYFITNVIEHIKNGNYMVDEYNNFWLYDRAKKREISAPTIKEVWVQRVLYDIMYPVFERTFIFDSHGCRKGKGTHSAIQNAHKYIKNQSNKNKYLKLDIRKYFYAINHEILFNILKRTIKDERFLCLVALYFKSPKNDFYDVLKKGCPLGNLLSQLFGLIYLNEMDNYIKRELKVKHYVRYVDDFILFDIENPEYYKEKIETFLKDKLDLTLSKQKQGITTLKFLGYRITKSGLRQNSKVYKKSKNKNHESTSAPLIHLGIKQNIDFELNSKMNKSIFNNYINKRFSHIPKNKRFEFVNKLLESVS